MNPLTAFVYATIFTFSMTIQCFSNTFLYSFIEHSTTIYTGTFYFNNHIVYDLRGETETYRWIVDKWGLPYLQEKQALIMIGHCQWEG